jgi:hypothetical protein
MTATTSAAIKFERKRNGSYEGKLNLKQSNIFAFRKELQLLQRQGYTVAPAQYEHDHRGLLTDKVWLYRAHRGNRTIWIHANSTHQVPA